ncbi:MAG TPA: substrate-binding domain-containing protein [Micromonosporaceae bacterium]|nr:substrate-binding domain-containing protein [Micromonosporaceae bacterium]
MRKSIRLLAITALLATGVAACGDDEGSGGTDGDKPKIGVILPDSASSARWETADRRFLQAAFDAAGVEADIQNAQGDKTQFQSIADQMITSGVDVLMIVNLDSGTGKAVLDRAKAQGIGTIDYDRLTVQGNADYYVSFDNVAVGRLQGEGLVKCLTDAGVSNPRIAVLNGSPTDNNAHLFKEGYDSILNPKFDSGEYVEVDDQFVPDWDNNQAGTIFEQMLTAAGGDVDGVLAANDGLGNAAITVLKRNGLNGKVPVTGQDATVQGLQNILAGDQCMTVYKAIKKEADAAAELAIALARGETPDTGATVKDPETGADVKAVLLEPVAITKENIKVVIDDGYVTRDELCAGDFAQLCTDAGL